MHLLAGHTHCGVHHRQHRLFLQAEVGCLTQKTRHRQQQAEVKKREDSGSFHRIANAVVDCVDEHAYINLYSHICLSPLFFFSSFALGM